MTDREILNKFLTIHKNMIKIIKMNQPRSEYLSQFELAIGFLIDELNGKDTPLTHSDSELEQVEKDKDV